MKRKYIMLWGAIMAQLVLAELGTVRFDFPWWVWAILLGELMVVEIIAVVSPAKGDTFSEMMWSFAEGGWSRGFLVGAVGLYLGMRFYMIGVGGDLPTWLPRAVLGTGLASWLTVHFVSLGKHG